MIELDIVERLRGKVRVPVNDGAGLLDGKDFFERQFPTSKLALTAADEIERLRAALRNVQKLVSEAAMTGFNHKDGDWPERLFESQQVTSAALKATVSSDERA